MIPTQEQITKLPKWARDRIAGLEGNVAYLEKQIAAMLRKPDADVQVSLWGVGDATDHIGQREMPLPDHTSFRWHFDQRHYHHYVEMRVDRQSGNLEVRTSYGRLTIHPHSANVVGVQVDKI